MDRSAPPAVQANPAQGWSNMMDRAALRQVLVEILEEDKGEKVETPADDIGLRDGLGLDSVDVVSLVMHIESRFRIRLPSEELEKLQRVGDLLDLLERKLAAAKAA